MEIKVSVLNLTVYISFSLWLIIAEHKLKIHYFLLSLLLQQ